MGYRRGQKIEIYQRSQDESWEAYTDELDLYRFMIGGMPGK